MESSESPVLLDQMNDPCELTDSEDEAIVEDILNTLKDRQDCKDDEDSGFLDNLFDASTETDSFDAVVEERLSAVDKNEPQIKLESLGLERFNMSLLQDFRSVEFLYLQNNQIASLSYEFFTMLDRLKYLDLRNNRLVTLPCNICYHKCLEVLLLQYNSFQSVPKELGSLPRLRSLQISGNPLLYPSPSIISQGPRAILEYLRREWGQYEISASRRQIRGIIEPANAMELMAKNGPQKMNNKGENIGKNQWNIKRQNSTFSKPIRSATITDLPKSVSNVKFESVDYKDNPNCMVVNKIKSEKLKKKIHPPSYTDDPDEINETWSISQISPKSISEPQNFEPASEPTKSNITKRHQMKLQHYSEIISAYEPFRTVSEPLDKSRTQEMYLRKLVDINRKFIANIREEALQRMKDRKVLSDWKEEYRSFCKTHREPIDVQASRSSPFAVYEDYQKIMSRQEQISGKSMERKSKPMSFVDQQRDVEAKINDIQKTLSSLDSQLNDCFQQGDGLDISSRDTAKTSSKTRSDVEKIFDEVLTRVEKPTFWLQQISKMQSLQNEIKNLVQRNGVLL